MRRISIMLAALSFVVGCSAGPSSQVSLSKQSPDGKYLAELVETPHGGFSNADGHFEIRVTTVSEKHPQSQTIYTSPDEGIDTRRFLWSNDGRYLLMVGKDLGVGPGDVTDKGEMIYLLYDARKHEVRCNSPRLSTPSKRFDFRDLAGINFGEEFRPEKLN